MSRTMEQHRAAHALSFVMASLHAGGDRAKLATHIQKTPVRILQNGLGQAMAFLLSEGKNQATTPAGRLYAHIQDWLCGPLGPDRPCRVYCGGGGGLMQQIIAGERRHYQLAEEEAIRLFTWLKKFADAYLDEEGGPHAQPGA